MSIDKKDVRVFIDGSNLYQGVKRCIGRYRIDIEGLAKKLCTPNRNLIGIHYYDAPYIKSISPQDYYEQQRFFEYLNKNKNISVTFGYHAIHPYRLNPTLYEKIKHVARKEDLEGPVEKSVDVALAVDMVSMAYEKQYGTAIIVSGDGDFVKAVEVVKRQKLRIQNAYFFNEERRGSSLKTACDSFIPLTKNSLSSLLLDFSIPATKK